jgi:hypothetical protein
LPLPEPDPEEEEADEDAAESPEDAEAAPNKEYQPKKPPPPLFNPELHEEEGQAFLKTTVRIFGKTEARLIPVQAKHPTLRTHALLPRLWRSTCTSCAW